MDSLNSNFGRLSKIKEIFIERLKSGQPIRMKIKGGSMNPFIRKSDMVIVKPIRFEETRIGDIIVYTRDLEQYFTVHRLIKKRRDNHGKEHLFTKGDVRFLLSHPGGNLKRYDGISFLCWNRFN